MKDFEQPLKDLVIPSTHLVAEMKKECTLKGQMVKRPGLILFAVNLYTLEAKKSRNKI